MTRISSQISSFLRHNEVICDEIRVIVPHMLNTKKTTILILCSLVFNPLHIHCFRVKKPFDMFEYVHGGGGPQEGEVTCFGG